MEGIDRPRWLDGRFASSTACTRSGIPAARCLVDDEIPTTTIPRTLLDMAPKLSPAQLTRACHEAWVRHNVAPQHVKACIARNPTKPGRAKLLAALGSDATLSDLGCHWPQLGLTVELVSDRFHAPRQAFEADELALRDVECQALLTQCPPESTA